MTHTNIFYVYEHVDPDTGETVYAGSGQGQRAWAMGNRTRLYAHFKWFKELEQRGWVLGDVVKIHSRGLNKAEALRTERWIVTEKKPRFNISGVSPNTYTRVGKERLRAQLLGNTNVTGSKWVTDGTTTRRIKPGQETPAGFNEGRATPWQ